MTEIEWNECGDIQKMLKFVKDKRKKRLFACACVRQVWHLLTDDRSKQAVIVSEKYADGLVSKEKLHEAREAASAAWSAYDSVWSAARSAYAADAATWAAAYDAADAARCATYDAWYFTTVWAAAAAKVSVNTYIPLLKDIFDPFNKYKQPHCNKYTKEFARNIYQNPNEKGELLDLHVLADMLIDQNVDQVLVDHLRNGIHVRGCQAIDLVMHN